MLCSPRPKHVACPRWPEPASFRWRTQRRRRSTRTSANKTLRPLRHRHDSRQRFPSDNAASAYQEWCPDGFSLYPFNRNKPLHILVVQPGAIFVSPKSGTNADEGSIEDDHILVALEAEKGSTTASARSVRSTARFWSTRHRFGTSNHGPISARIDSGHLQTVHPFGANCAPNRTNSCDV